MADEGLRQRFPRQRAAAGRKVKIEAQRVERGATGLTPPGAEIVVDVEARHTLEHGTDESGQVETLRTGADGGVPDIDQHLGRLRVQALHERGNRLRVMADARPRRKDGAQVLEAEKDAQGLRWG